MLKRAAIPYLLVSGICLLLHNVVMITAMHRSFPLVMAVALSFCIVVATGYVLHSLLSFRQPLSLRRFWRYAAAMSLNMPLALVTIWLWKDIAGCPVVVAVPLATVTMLAANSLFSYWAIVAPQFGVRFR